MTRYGYVRVSTREQHVDRQLAALLEEGIAEKNIYIDQASGKSFQRQAYQQLRRKLKKGDELWVKSIDRLGRNYQEMMKEWRYLVYEKRIVVVILDLPLLKEFRMSTDVTKQLLSDLILQLFSYVAQIEREMIHTRQMEGILQAKKRGVSFGRPKCEMSEQFEEVLRHYRDKTMTVAQCCECLGVSRGTFYKWVRERKR